MQSLTTKLYKLDYGFIYKNYLNKNLWGKKWILFEYEEHKIYAQLNCIDIKNSRIEITLDVQSSANTWWIQTESVYLPLAEEHRNYEVFEKKTKSSVLRLISRIEAVLIRDLEVYKIAYNTKNEERYRLEEIARCFLDEHGIENRDIRDTYIDAYVTANLHDYTWDVLEKYKHRVIPGAYLLYASYMNDEDLYEEYRKEIENKVTEEELEEAIKDSKDRLEYIQTENFEEEMKYELEDI